MPKKSRKIEAISPGEGTLSPQAATPASGAARVLTKGKGVFKRMFHRGIDKEAKEPAGIEIVRQHKSEEPIAAGLEDVPAVVSLPSTVGTDTHDASGKKDKGRSAATHEVPENVQPVQPIVKVIRGAEEKISTVESIPGPVEAAVNLIVPANTAIAQLDAIDATYLQPLHAFNTVVTGIANIHPYASMALSALTTASNLILSQANLDASIGDLITRINQTYERILENTSSSKINAIKDVLAEIAQVVQECAQFIVKYSETKSFWCRLGKNVLSETASKVANYNSKLDKLMQELRDQALLTVQYDVQQTQETLCLDSLAYAGGVGLIKAKKCLDGTRTDVLNEVVDWVNSTDAAAPRIYWLYGQAGKGKSAIAHTIALQAQNLGVLGSCFCFSRVRQHEGLHMKLFPTIVRDLADRDLRLRPLLAKAITNNRSLRETADIAEQWQKLIVEPLSRLGGSSTGNVVLVIDALDESGAEATRAAFLEVLAACDAELPANIRILLTSRPLMDIGEVLNTAGHVQARSLDDINAELTIRDICLYVSTRLKSLGDTFSDENLQQLAAKSDGVFEWARLACDFISQRIKTIAQRRLQEIMSHAPGGGRTLLDAMYTTFLKELTRGSSDVLAMFCSVMRQLLWLKKPLPISALDFMRARFPREDDRYPVRDILQPMASLLSGISDTFTPVRPLHASFYDFLRDENRSGEFFIQQGDVHRDLAVASLSVMQAGLRFNICGLETSYISNSEVEGLEKRVEENIPPHLLYACQFWATHLKDVGFDAELAKSVGWLVTGEQMLFWLEALGVSKLIREACQALISAERWLQGQMEYKDVLMFTRDGIKFVQNFAGIIDKSTPHVYLSALPFLPCKSMLAKCLAKSFSRIAQVAVGQHDDWPRIQHALQGHTSTVWSVAFSPDGKHIVSGSSDKTI